MDIFAGLILDKEDRVNKRTKPLILVTNDDGINAKGLKALIDVVKPLGKLVVVAPEDSNSGMSHAITVKIPIRVSHISDNGDVSLYRCSGTPVDCVKVAINQLLDRKPDLLVAGINHGSNAGISVVYSGTMAAAIEGCINDITSLGLSLMDHSKNADFTLASRYAKKIITNVLNKKIPENTCLNVNFPVFPIDEIKGVKICRQTRGVWKEEYDKRQDPRNRNYYWLTGQFINFESDNEDTDEWALRNKYISIVPVKVDFTSYETIDRLKKWDFDL